MAVTTEQTSSATFHPPNTPPPSTPAGSVHSEAANTSQPADPAPTHPNISLPQPQPPKHHRRREHGRRRRRRRHHRKHSRGRRTHRQSRTTHQHRSSRHHRSRSPSTSYYSYSRSPPPSRSRSRPAISLLPNTDSLQQDATSNQSQLSYHSSSSQGRQPLATPTAFSPENPQEQLEIWMDYHADQFDTPNKPQHTYVARLLLDSGFTYKDICDYRQFTHTKWNDTTSSYDIFHCIPSLSQKASRRFPPPAARATSTSPDLSTSTPATLAQSATSAAFYNRAVFSPAPSTFPTTQASSRKESASLNSCNTTTASKLASSTTLGTLQRTPIPSSSPW